MANGSSNPLDRFEKMDAEIKNFAGKHRQIISEFMDLVDARNKVVVAARAFIKDKEKDSAPFRYEEAKNVSWNSETLKGILPKAIYNRITETTVHKPSLDAAIKKGEIDEKEILEAKTVKIVKKCFGPDAWEISREELDI